MKLLFIQTGGTIDKGYPANDDNHGYNFEITTPAFERILSRMSLSFEFETKTVLQKDSVDITDEDRKLIVKACTETPHDRIVITHGTDTMIQTAKALSSIKGKTIVLTGAMLPEEFKDSDADFNLGEAVAAATTKDEGVYIAMGGRVFAHDNVTYDAEAGQFASLNE